MSVSTSTLWSSCVVVTYNCAKLRQEDQCVAQIVNEALAKTENRQPDIIALCLQEVAPLIDSCLDWTDDWLGPFRKAVPESFTPIAEAVSGACAVLVFTNNVDDIAHVDFDRTAFGALWSSLKGAALVSIAFRGPRGTLTIVSAHLCANEGNKELRDRDFKYLLEDFELTKLKGQVIIAGDLNYRTTDGTIETDELRSGMASRGVAPGYMEGSIAFPPTYKFHVGTNTYDKTKRTPSFCDRVLLREFKGVKVVDYDSLELPDLKSDHKPVVAVIETLTRTRRVRDRWVLDENDPSDEDLELRQQEQQQQQEHGFDQRDQRDKLISVLPRRPSNLRVPRIRTLLSDTLIGITLFTFTTRKGLISLAALAVLFLLSRL